MNKTTQILSITGNGNRAKVTLYEKQLGENWHEVITTNEGYIGRNGFGKTKEGDGKTPIGTYYFTKAFGIKDNPGTSFAYTKVDDTHYWVDDGASKYYNQFVSTRNVKKDWNSAEHICEEKSAYNYVMALNYNAACVPEIGSGIFLHCAVDRATAGCIAVPEDVMIQLMKVIYRDCMVVIENNYCFPCQKTLYL